jgi:hypothetical protein
MKRFETNCCKIWYSGVPLKFVSSFKVWLKLEKEYRDLWVNEDIFGIRKEKEYRDLWVNEDIFGICKEKEYRDLWVSDGIFGICKTIYGACKIENNIIP